MTQINQGLRSFLNKSAMYNLFQSVTGGTRARKLCIDNHVRPQENWQILDIGCGPGTLLDYLPFSTNYYGIDFNQDYINQAKKRFINRGSFFCDDLTRKDFANRLPQFDCILGMGILHHLNDREVVSLLQVTKGLLKPGGRIVTLDGCYVENQSRIARFFLKHDRGQNVRTVNEYHSLTRQVFSDVNISLRHDMFRIPYTVIIMECAKYR